MTQDQDQGASPEQARRDAILEALSLAIVAKREEAIKGRHNSGIEQVWTEDEEFYEGYDAANRHEFKPLSQSKPTEGGQTPPPAERKGSTLFPNITAPYVDTAAAKISDMLMGASDWRNFEVKSTPIPKLLHQPKPPEPEASQPGMPPGGGPANPLPPQNPAQAIMGGPAPGMQPPPAAPQPAPDPLAQLMAKFKAAKAAADDAAKKAEDAIDDALVECQFQEKMRQIIHDSAKLGTGVIKGPAPHKRKTRVYDAETNALVVDIETVPDSQRVDVRNCYPDYPACGEDIHAGNHFFEFAPCTEKQLRALKGGQGPAAYLDEQIDKCIAEGPSKSKENANGLPVPETNYPRWYFYGVLKTSEAQIGGAQVPQDKSDDELLPVIATLVNDRVVKIALNPLEANEFPYDFLVWKARSGMPWGIGVTRQARTGQRIATASLRNLMDNAGASAKPHKVMTDAVEQEGDPWTWRASSETTDVRGAMQFFVQPNLQEQLMNIISLGRQQIELETGLPMTVLGMQGNIEETAKGRTILNNNGSTVLRRIARNFDAATESHVRRYYSWLLLHSDDESLKGDMQIQARGSSALVERDLQSQQLPMVMQMAGDPSLRMSKIKARDEILLSMHFDPARFEMDPEEESKLEATPPQPPVPVQVAQIREEGATKRAEMQEQGEMQRTQMELAAQAQAAGAERAQDAQQGELDRQMQMVLGQINERIAAIKSQGANEQTIQQIKGMLAATTIKVQAQRDLSPGPQVVTPPDEPAGRAPNGQAYAR